MRGSAPVAAVIAAAASLAFTLTGCGGGNQATTSAPDTTTASGAPSATPDTPPPAPPAEGAPSGPPATNFGDGTYVVGKDIAPGTYHSEGAALPGVDCYWERAHDTSGATQSVIANHAGREPVTVTISANDGAFRTIGCKTWAMSGK